jgi:hypothetical protein
MDVTHSLFLQLLLAKAFSCFTAATLEGTGGLIVYCRDLFCYSVPLERLAIDSYDNELYISGLAKFLEQ